ncbi:MAG: universal stress protein [Spirochaetia bacterium]|nr:universal stress protein [Spirochaetia bacterium]
MFRKMLIATDLTESSEFIIHALQSLHRWGTREALIVHCFDFHDTGSVTNRTLELVEPFMKRQVEQLKNFGFTAESKLILGKPHIEVTREAEENDCSLIACADKSRSLMGEALSGGVAAELIHFATKPVLLIRLREKPEFSTTNRNYECECLKHILFPTDFSDNAEHAFSYLKKLAECKADHISLLHVQDKAKLHPHLSDRIEEFNEIDAERLERMKKVLLAAGAGTVSIDVVYGSPKSEILKKIKEDDVRLTVMGSQGRGYVGDIFLGSVSHAVARKAESSLLLVPAIS